MPAVQDAVPAMRSPEEPTDQDVVVAAAERPAAKQRTEGIFVVADSRVLIAAGALNVYVFAVMLSVADAGDAAVHATEGAVG